MKLHWATAEKKRRKREKAREVCTGKPLWGPALAATPNFELHDQPSSEDGFQLVRPQRAGLPGFFCEFLVLA